MKRLIGKKVKTKIYGDGIVTHCIDNDVLKKIIISFGDDERLFEFKTVINNKIIIFEDEKMQEIAEELCNKRPVDDDLMPIALSGCPAPTMPKNLVQYTSYGANINEIYHEMCLIYGWRSSLSEDLKYQNEKYLKKVDGENSIWFVSYSNLSYDGSINYTTTFKNNMQTIEEEYIYSNDYTNYEDNLGDVRIVFYNKPITRPAIIPGRPVVDRFARKRYYFAGIYKQTEHFVNDKNHHVLVYEKISDTYPLEDNPFE